MNAASQVPSGVLTSTSVSTTSRPAGAADAAVAARPAVTERPTKSRRAISPGCASFFCWFFWSSVMMVTPSKRLYRFLILVSQCQLVHAKGGVPLPAQPLIQRLRGRVGHLGRKHKPRRTDEARIFGGRLEQRGSCSASACFRSHEQIVQDKDPRHRTGREARIELSEPDSSGAVER